MTKSNGATEGGMLMVLMDLIGLMGLMPRQMYYAMRKHNIDIKKDVKRRSRNLDCRSLRRQGFAQGIQAKAGAFGILKNLEDLFARGRGDNEIVIGSLQ